MANGQNSGGRFAWLGVGAFALIALALLAYLMAPKRQNSPVNSETQVAAAKVEEGAAPSAEPSTAEPKTQATPSPAGGASAEPTTDAPKPSSTPPIAEELGTILVTVKIEGDISVVPGAAVTLWKLSQSTKPSERIHTIQGEAVSDADGKVRFEGLPLGRYFLTAAKGDLASEARFRRDDIPEVEGPAPLNETVWLREGYFIRGLVRDAQSGAPIVGAKVTAPRVDRTVTPPQLFGNATEVTDDLGRFAFARIYDRSPTIAARAKDFEEKRVPINADDLLPKTKDRVIETVIDLQPGWTLTGRVVDTKGVGVEGAYVSWTWVQDHPLGFAPAFSGKDGAFEITLPRYSDRLTLLRASINNCNAGSSAEFMPSTMRTTPIEIVLPGAGFIEGTVVDEAGSPIRDAEVRAGVATSIGTSMSNFICGLTPTPTDEAGWFILGDVGAGKVTVTASAKGYAKVEESVELKAGGHIRSLKITLQKAHFLAGRITRADGTPAAKVTVTHPKFADSHIRNISTTTDGDGKYRLDGLPGGKINIMVSGFSVTTALFGDIEVDREDADFMVEEAETFTFVGTVIDGATKLPIQTYSAKLILASDIRPEGMLPIAEPVVSPGQFRHQLPYFMPYRHRVSAEGYADAESSWMNPPAPADPSPTHIFELYAGRALTGRVVSDGDNQPLEGVSVTHALDGVGLQGKGAVTDADGRFSIPNLAPGKYRVNFTPQPPFVPRNESVVVAKEADTDMGVVRLNSGAAITVTVLGADRAPKAGVTVSLTDRQGSPRMVDSDARGIARFEALASGNYTASAAGAKQRLTFAEVSDGDSRAGTIVLGEGVFRGTVMRGGKPEIGARVTVTFVSDGTEQRFPSVAADEAGKFEITGLPLGKAFVEVGAIYGPNGASPITDEIEIVEGVPVVRAYELPSLELRVRVVDDPTGEPVENARILGSSGSAGVVEGFTSPKGLATLGGLSGEEVLLRVSHANFGSGQIMRGIGAVNGDPFAEWDVEIRLKKNGGTLESVALRLADGGPVARAWLKLWDSSGVLLLHSWDNGLQRDQMGVLRVPNLQPGAYRTEVSHWGHSAATREVEIREGETTTIEDVLYEAGSMKWSLTRANGEPIVGATIEVRPRAADSIERPRTGKTNSRGSYETRGLQPGEYDASAEFTDGNLSDGNMRQVSLMQVFQIQASGHTEFISRAP